MATPSGDAQVRVRGVAESKHDRESATADRVVQKGHRGVPPKARRAARRARGDPERRAEGGPGATEEGGLRWRASEDRKDFVRGFVTAADGEVTERKTGVKHAEVVTPQLLQDERGWAPVGGLERRRTADRGRVEAPGVC